MKARSAAAATALVLAVAAAATGGTRPITAAAAAAQTDNYAAVVVDTGDGKVREFCLSFSEAEISGIEALQRVDVRPYRFETYGSKGSGVCMLCGVGCESGDCFCNPSKFWAYHRSGPGEDDYTMSRAGASSTRVRNGDVEAWKWGGGESPAKRSVGEICQIEEPPPRAKETGGTPTTEATTTTTSSRASPPRAPSETAATSPPPPADARAEPHDRGPQATRPPAFGPEANSDAQPAGTPTADAEPGPTEPNAANEGAAPAAAKVKRGLEAEGGAAPSRIEKGESRTSDAVAGGAFATLLAGLIAWRAKLRRANVRRMDPGR